MMARYGPREAGEESPSPLATEGDSNQNAGADNDDGDSRSQLKSEFADLLRIILNGTIPEEEYPSLLAKNIGTILDVMSLDRGTQMEGMIQEIVSEDLLGEDGTAGGNANPDAGDRLERISEAIDLVLSFAETFVEEAKSMDDVYKRLLGKIFTSIAPAAANPQAVKTEDHLDDLLSHEKEAFTPGFLRHVEGECERLSSLKTLSPESTQMLQILRLIQTRVLEELGKVRVIASCGPRKYLHALGHVSLSRI